MQLREAQKRKNLPASGPSIRKKKTKNEMSYQILDFVQKTVEGRAQTKLSNTIE